MRKDTLPLEHFEDLYARDEDPWHFADSTYEREKYAATLQALPRETYASGLEIGCSIGVLTALLAERCRSLLAIEPVERALAAARQRNATRPWVRFAPMFVPREWPDGRFDLIVLSEVLDYLGEADVDLLAERLQTSVASKGDVVMVHWVGKKRPGPVRATETSDRLVECCRGFLQLRHQERNPSYRLDSLRRID